MSLDDKFGILVRKSKKISASRGFRNLSGPFPSQKFPETLVKEKIWLEFSQFLAISAIHLSKSSKKSP